MVKTPALDSNKTNNSEYIKTRYWLLAILSYSTNRTLLASSWTQGYPGTPGGIAIGTLGIGSAGPSGIIPACAAAVGGYTIGAKTFGIRFPRCALLVSIVGKSLTSGDFFWETSSCCFPSGALAKYNLDRTKGPSNLGTEPGAVVGEWHAA